jgi:hypothetical protein
VVTVTVAALLERDAVWSGRWDPTFYRNQNPNTVLVRSDIFTVVTVTVAALLERDAVWSGGWDPTFYRNPLSSSG